MSDTISKPGVSLRSKPQPGEPTVALGEGKLGQPQWAGCYLQDWEILVYQQEEGWEACFFNWAGHHEHIKASSLSDACRKAEDRIEVLETAAPKKGALATKA